MTKNALERINKISGQPGHSPVWLQHKLLLNFAKLNGWSKPRDFHGSSFFTPRTLVEARTTATRDDLTEWHKRASGITGGFDHLIWLRKNRKPVALVSQPYTGMVYGRSDETLVPDALKNLGLQVHTPPNPFACFHNPGSCLFIVLTRKDQTVEWLPDQLEYTKQPLDVDPKVPIK